MSELNRGSVGLRDEKRIGSVFMCVLRWHVRTSGQSYKQSTNISLYLFFREMRYSVFYLVSADSRVVTYNHRLFIRLATVLPSIKRGTESNIFIMAL